METSRLDPDTDDDTRATIPDDDAGEWAICELVQRAAWAAEIGLDPRAVDLVAMPPA